ncbi:MAG: hypothetical protein AAFZ05_12960 [Pseudomonadota bacterium]
MTDAPMTGPAAARDASEPWVRLSVAHALDAPLAVIFRRGPRYRHQMIVWNTDTDTFDAGQWMTGDVYLHSVSPDGRFVLYGARQISDRARAKWAAQLANARSADHEAEHDYEPLVATQRARRPKRSKRKVPRYLRQSARPARPGLVDPSIGAWTAISRPPNFTALAIWLVAGPYQGGGYFAGETELVLNYPRELMAPKLNAPRWPHRFKMSAIEDVAGGRPKYWSAYLASARRPETWGDTVRALRRKLPKHGYVDWVDLFDDTRLTFAANGCIWRVARDVADQTDDLLGRADLIADFRGNTFEPVTPRADALSW